MIARPQGLDPENHRRGGIPSTGKSRYYSPVKLALGVPIPPGPQEGWLLAPSAPAATIAALNVHKNENFFGFDFEFCTISMLVMHK